MNRIIKLGVLIITTCVSAFSIGGGYVKLNEAKRRKKVMDDSLNRAKKAKEESDDVEESI